jgi:hypothetical protein
MRKKIFGILVCMLFILTTMVSVVSAEQERNNYRGCYIEASGEISEKDWFAIIRLPNMWKTFWFRPPLDEQKAVVSFWRIVYDSESTVTIYSKQNGDILWDHNGRQDVHLILVGFRGIYLPERNNPDDPLHVEISGNALFVKTRLI